MKKKGIKVKEISQTCKVHIHIDTEFIYPRKEFRVHISGNPLQCKKAMGKILELIRQVKFYQQYPLKIHVDSQYMACIIGKKGQFIRKIKNVSGAYQVKLFPTRHETQRSGILVINHFNIYNCIKAVGMALNKICTIAKYNMVLPEQKVVKSSVLTAKIVKYGTPKYRIKKSESIQTGIIKGNEVANATQIKYKTISNQNTAEKVSENSAVEAEVNE